MLFAIVANLDIHCHQMDVKTAFLNRDLDQDVFMEQSEGCIDPDKPDFVCKLQKALYGLMQAPRQWYAKLNSFLTESLHFQSSPYDPCLYVFNKDGKKALISLYVGDLLLASSDLEFLHFAICLKWRTVEKQASALDLKIVEIVLRKNSTLAKSRYAAKVLERFGMAS